MPTESNHPIVARTTINPVAQYLMALAIVIGAYSAYLKFAVPAIEGPANLVKKRSYSTPIDELPSPRDEKSYLIPLLPADAWELSDCKTLLIDAGTILFKKLEQQEDGSLQIQPFTLITGLEDDSLASPNRTSTKSPTVLRCLTGAKLKFNKPLRELFGSQAKMESAQLSGRVDIYRPPSQSNKNDALHVATSNVKVDKHQIFTLEQVEFTFGPNQGSGRNMVIDLAHEDESTALIDFSSINGISRLEIAFLDKIRVETSSKTSLAGADSKNETAAGDPLSNRSQKLFSNSDSPLEITCKGPFVFDFAAKTASFQKQVVAEQVDAFRDNIRCDELTLILEDKTDSLQSPGPVFLQPSTIGNPPNQSADDLQLKRIVAKGSPAIVVSRSRSAKISGEYLSYDVPSHRIEGSCSANTKEMVTIVTPDYQMVAKHLTYQMAEDGSMGEISEC